MIDPIGNWGDKVISHFDQSAQNYNASATLQHAVAGQLANHCKQQLIPEGLWVDLGLTWGRLQATSGRLQSDFRPKSGNFGRLLNFTSA